MSSLSRAIAAVGLSGLSLVAGAATVFSEDFTNPSFDNLTTYNPEGGLSDGLNTTQPAHYALVSDPGKYFRPEYHFADYYDHTTGTAAGTMLFFDAATDASRIWYRTASLTAGIEYFFSFWMSSAGQSNPPSDAAAPFIALSKDGTQVASLGVVSVGSWVNSTYQFTQDVTGDVTFALSDLNTLSDFNDGAIDDISLTFSQMVGPVDPGNPIPEPQQAALMAGGLAVLAWMTRRKALPSAPPSTFAAAVV